MLVDWPKATGAAASPAWATGAPAILPSRHIDIACGGLRRARERIKATHAPAPNRTANSWTPANPSAVTTIAAAISDLVLSTLRPSRHRACSTMAITTGLMP